MKEKEQKNIKDINEKVCKIYYEAFDRILRVNVMLKCLETACNYDDDLTTKDVQLFIEEISQKTAEIEEYIDELSLI